MLYTTTDEDKGIRLDTLLSQKFDLSSSAAAKACDEGRVLVDGVRREKKFQAPVGADIEYTELPAQEYSVKAEDIPLDIVFEDDDIIVINKPKGMVVHPAAGNPDGTLVNALLHHCRDSLSGIGGVLRPGIVHRIDKDTTGLLVVAKNDFSHLALAKELEVHEVTREYHALMTGLIDEGVTTVDLPIGRHPKDRKLMAVHPKSSTVAKDAVTHLERISSYAVTGGKISYARLNLETGRTHQIRVHMSHLHHPLLGDEVYGGGRSAFEKTHAKLLCGQALHAKKLTLTHPRTKERMTFECELPEYFKRLLEILEPFKIS